MHTDAQRALTAVIVIASGNPAVVVSPMLTEPIALAASVSDLVMLAHLLEAAQEYVQDRLRREVGSQRLVDALMEAPPEREPDPGAEGDVDY